jgi:hypothetical protein
LAGLLNVDEITLERTVDGVSDELRFHLLTNPNLRKQVVELGFLSPDEPALIETIIP